MNRSATIGWRIFFAHLTDLGIWFYIIFFVVGLISHNLFIKIILSYIAALLLSFTFSGLWFSRSGFTPSEWLWGCKLQIRDSGGNRFFSYFVHRIYSNGPEYGDDKNSVWKIGIGLIILAAVLCFSARAIISEFPNRVVVDPHSQNIIYPEAKISPNQFMSQLEKMPDGQRMALWKALELTDRKPDKEITAWELNDRLLWESFSALTYHIKKVFDYHDTVKWLAKVIGLPAAPQTTTTLQIEREIMEKIFADCWDRLKPEQRKEILERIGLSGRVAKVKGKDVISDSRIQAKFYQLAKLTFAAVKKANPHQSPEEVVSSVRAFWKGGPNAKKVASFVIALHLWKADEMIKSEMDISQYLWK